MTPERKRRWLALACGLGLLASACGAGPDGGELGLATDEATVDRATPQTSSVQVQSTTTEPDDAAVDGQNTSEPDAPVEGNPSGTASFLRCEAPPADSADVRFTPDWTGSSGRFLKLRTTETTSSGRVTAVTPVLISAVAGDERSLNVAWSYGATDFQDAVGNTLDPTTVGLSGPGAGTQIAYRLDGSRRWLGLSELGLGDQPGQDEAPQLLHLLENITVPVGEAVTRPGTLPNPLGGSPFPATMSIRLATLADAEGCTVLEATMTLDDETFLPLLEASLKEAVGDDAVDDLATMADQYRLEQRVIARFDSSTGFIADITSVTLTGDVAEADARVLSVVDEGPLEG